MKELVEHVSRVGFVVAIAQKLLLQNIAGILLQQLAQIRLDDRIGRGAGDMNRNAIRSRRADCLS